MHVAHPAITVLNQGTWRSQPRWTDASSTLIGSSSFRNRQLSSPTSNRTRFVRLPWFFLASSFERGAGYEASNGLETTLPMKHLSLLFVVAMVALCGLIVGCTPKHEPESGALRTAFAQAPQDQKDAATAAMAAIKAKQYEEAVTQLSKLEGQELSAEQKQAVADVLVDIQSYLTNHGGSAEVLEKVQNLMMSFM